MIGRAFSSPTLRGALLFAIPAALALLVVVRCGYRYPYSDDWDLVVPFMDGQYQISRSSLWAQHNEHRIPIPRLILIASDLLFDGSFLGGVVASWLMLVAISLVLYRPLRKWAGAPPAWAGLLLAAIVLNPSNNALRWGVEGQFVVSAALMVMAASAALYAPSPTTISIAGLASALLPLTGGNGVLFSFAAIALTIYLAARSRRTDVHAIAAVAVAITLLVIGCYFVGYRSPPNHEALATRSLLSAAIVFGHLVIAPFGPYASRLFAVAAPLSFLALGAIALSLWRADQADVSKRPITIVVVITTLGTAAVFGAIAFGRGARGWPPGLETHYASLGIPFWGISCVGLLAVGARRLASALCIVATVAFVVGLPLGPRPPWASAGAAFRRDWCADVRTDELADRYIQLLYYVDTPEARRSVASRLTAMRAHPVGGWKCRSEPVRGN